MDRMDPEQVRQLLRAVNDLRGDAMVFISLLVLFGLIYLTVRHYLSIRKERATEKMKQNRADQYANALTSISTAFTSQSAKSDMMMERLNNTMRDVNGSINKVDTCLVSLLTYTSGTINYQDSVRLVKDRFLKEIRRSVYYIIEKSLAENDYENRKEFVSKKVKTAIGDLLQECRDDLNSYKLAINPRDFFLVTREPGVERFLLCDMLWNEIESLYRSRVDLRHKLEEANLNIENVIKDYLTGLEEKVREKTPTQLLPIVSLEKAV